MSLRETLRKAGTALSENGINHALIGGMALATLGIHRATADVDLIIDGFQSDGAKLALKKAGFILKYESKEVMHFEGVGYLDILLANRPLSKQMLENAKVYPQHGIKCLCVEDIIGLKIQAYVNDRKRELQDKADIKSLLSKFPGLDREKVKTYADIFGEWEAIQFLGRQP